MAVPKEVTRLYTALLRLPAVHSVDSSVESLQGFTEEDIRLAAFAQMPHGTLRRTAGGRAGEIYVQFEFRLEPNPTGWRALEFLAWFVRDQARTGRALQLRPFALPPTAPQGAQLDQTLRFHLDLFVVEPTGKLDPVLQEVGGIAKDLALATDLYDSALRQAGHPGLLPDSARIIRANRRKR